MDGRRIKVPACGGPNRKKVRAAKLTLRCTPVELIAPTDRGDDTPIRMIAVSVREEDPSRRPALPASKIGKKKKQPLHWMLLTTEGEADLDTACTVLHWYELRWRIERFFHALKVGTRIEDRRLDEADEPEEVSRLRRNHRVQRLGSFDSRAREAGRAG